jgi:hypothetical protein
MKSPQYTIQTKAPNGEWAAKYKCLSRTQYPIYWAGICAHNGHKARLLKGKTVIAIKNELD